MTTLREVADEIRKLAAESPDNIYLPPDGPGGMCYFTRGHCTNGSVGCIVGQAIARLGFDIANLDRKASNPVKACEVFGIVPNNPCTYWLYVIVDYQDAGCTWGEAVRAADDTLNHGLAGRERAAAQGCAATDAVKGHGQIPPASTEQTGAVFL